MNDYEDFRSRFETILKEGKLEKYIGDRVSGREENPSLESRFGEEVPEQILWHFGKDYPEIYTAARTMLRKVSKDNKKAQDGEYCWGLSFLLADHDKEAPSIAINLLLGMGSPLLPKPYFAERAELGLLRLAVHCDYDGFSDEGKKQAEGLFTNYIENYPELSEMASAALKKLRSKRITNLSN